jgi:hypothetical protein
MIYQRPGQKSAFGGPNRGSKYGFKPLSLIVYVCFSFHTTASFFNGKDDAIFSQKKKPNFLKSLSFWGFSGLLIFVSAE